MSATCRQQAIVDALERLDAPATVDQLVDVLVASPDDFSRTLERWGDVHEELHVVDLPVLDALDVVDYDRETGLVALPSTNVEQSTATGTETASVAQ